MKKDHYISTIDEIAEYFEQDLSSISAWSFTPKRRKEIATFLRHHKENIESQPIERNIINGLIGE